MAVHGHDLLKRGQGGGQAQRTFADAKIGVILPRSNKRYLLARRQRVSSVVSREAVLRGAIVFAPCPLMTQRAARMLAPKRTSCPREQGVVVFVGSSDVIPMCSTGREARGTRGEAEELRGHADSAPLGSLSGVEETRGFASDADSPTPPTLGTRQDPPQAGRTRVVWGRGVRGCIARNAFRSYPSYRDTTL